MTLYVRPAAVLDDPTRFARWWASRREPNDMGILRAAKRRGLVYKVRGSDLIFLTSAGKALRAGAASARVIPEGKPNGA